MRLRRSLPAGLEKALGAALCLAALVIVWLASAPRSTHAANNEGVTGLPADVTPSLSVAGIWQPVDGQYINTQNHGALANTFIGNIDLINGREGIVVAGWSFSGFSTSSTTITPVKIALLDQQPDGTLQLSTSKYISNPQTNGSSSVVMADFNRDGIQDIFLAAHNESPPLPASSTAYLSNADGTYSKVDVGDLVEAHDGNLAYINGSPTVFTGSYYTTPPPNGHANTAIQFKGNGFDVTQDIGTSSSSVAVADFYGDGIYSAVFGDDIYGPNYPYVPDYVEGIYLWRLKNLGLSGNPVNVGNPYFDTPQYAAYQSFQDPHGKQHNARVWTDDFNHDGMRDIVVQGSIWSPTAGTQKTILQMFQNAGGYRFTDVTDLLATAYDKNGTECDYTPQIRDIDGSGINSYLSAGTPVYGNVSQPNSNYLIVNDGTGNLEVALHEQLNTYGVQVMSWLRKNPPAGLYIPQSPDPGYAIPKLRAYQTSNGRSELPRGRGRNDHRQHLCQ